MSEINTNNRPDWDHYFMRFAEAAATRGTCDRKFVGAVIVVDKQVIATGYNGSVVGMPHCSIEGEHAWKRAEHRSAYKFGLHNPSVCVSCGTKEGREPEKCPPAGHDMQDGHCVRTIHAEMNAIAQAAKRGVKIGGSTIYTTASPCWDCFRVLVNAGVRRFVFKEAYRADENAERIKAVVSVPALGVVVEQLT
jgi:dCMP deaminase